MDRVAYPFEPSTGVQLADRSEIALHAGYIHGFLDVFAQRLDKPWLSQHFLTRVEDMQTTE